jgi:hypothetical protein
VIYFATDRRQEAVSAISAAVGQELDFPPDWDVLAAVVDGVVVGGAVVSGSEVHCGVVTPIFMRPLIRDLFPKLLDKHGKITTKVRASNTIGQRFVGRLGFNKTGESGEVFTYELTRIRHV